MSIDVSSLFDFRDPAGTEARLTDALAGASGDDALVLRTQIARTHGLRRDFDRARAILAGIEPALATAGPEPRVRYELELGRSHVSATHPPEQLTPEAVDAARVAYTRAFETARAAGLDGLAVDAIHMMAFVDTAPDAQIAWNAKGLELALGSSDPAARRWEASLRNNQGMALHEAGRDREALHEFERALALRETMGDPGNIRVARWAIAWTLRHLGRPEEALAMQQALERDCDEAGEPDEYVFEELELLSRELGDDAGAARAAARLADLRGAAPA